MRKKSLFEKIDGIFIRMEISGKTSRSFNVFGQIMLRDKKFTPFIKIF
jgi:hypothetical protein